MTRRLLTYTCLSVLVWLVMSSFCARAVMAQASEYESLKAPKDASMVVFYRPGSLGVTRQTIVYDGDRPLMTFHKKHKYTYVTTPGKHIFKVFSIRSVDFMEADLLPGRTYFALISSSMFGVRFQPEHSEDYGLKKLIEEVNDCEERNIPESEVQQFVEEHKARLERLNKTGTGSFRAEPKANRKRLAADSGVVIPIGQERTVTERPSAPVPKLPVVPGLSAPKDNAVIVFYRPYGKEFPFRIVVFDGVSPVVSLSPQSRYVYTCSPGKHLLKLFSLEHESVDVLEANVIAGRTYFLEIHPQLKDAGEETGGEGVSVSDRNVSYSVHFIPQLYPADYWSEILKKLSGCMEASSQENLSDWAIAHSEEIRTLDEKGVNKFLQSKENASARLPSEGGIVVNEDGSIS